MQDIKDTRRIRSFCIIGDELSADFLAFAVVGVFRGNLLVTKNEDNIRIMTDTHTGVVVSSDATADQFEFFMTTEANGMATSEYLTAVLDHTHTHNNLLEELCFFVHVIRLGNTLRLTVHDKRVGPKPVLSACYVRSGWCDIDSVKRVRRDPKSDSWKIMNASFQALAAGEIDVIRNAMCDSIAKTMLPLRDTNVVQPKLAKVTVWAEDHVGQLSDVSIEPIVCVPIVSPEHPGDVLTTRNRKRSISEDDTIIKRPAGYLSGFNVFARERRKEFEQRFPGTEKNEMNKIVGRAWKELPSSVRAGYELRADQDKLRYLAEVERYNAMAALMEGNPHVPRINHPVDESTLPADVKRPRSAYNHFGRQEGQALRLIPELRSKMSSYFSNRWHEIETEEVYDDAGNCEKDLYLQLERADLEECQEQLKRTTSESSAAV